MKTREDLKLEFEVWFKANFPEPADADPQRMAAAKELARRAFYEGNAIGFNDGMSAAAEMEGAGR